MSDPEVAPTPNVDARVRAAYEGNVVYKTETICMSDRADGQTYTDRLLTDRLEAIRRYRQPGAMLDLCCGTGAHLFELTGQGQTGIGIDFSRPFIAKAESDRRAAQRTELGFAVSDARSLPLPDASVSTVYSLSALYAVPGPERAIAEIGRVLLPGGYAIFDVGNKRSLNSFCVGYYPEIPPTFHMALGDLWAVCRQQRLEIVEHRAFQILPLWADRPDWLWLLLHPVWKRWLSRRIGGRMIDEWICKIPGFRQLAFRHLLVCRKV